MPRLSDHEIEEHVARLEGWARRGDAIVKEVDCGNFTGSVELVNRIARVAEDMNHHPDLSISWATVTISVTTHSEGGLTASDFELAQRIDGLG